MTHLKIGIPSLKGSKGQNPPPLMGKKMQNRTLEIPDLNATKSSKSRLTPTNAQTQYSLFKQAKMYLQNRLFAYGQCTYIVPTCTHIVNRYLHCRQNGTLYTGTYILQWYFVPMCLPMYLQTNCLWPKSKTPPVLYFRVILFGSQSP